MQTMCLPIENPASGPRGRYLDEVQDPELQLLEALDPELQLLEAHDLESQDLESQDLEDQNMEGQEVPQVAQNSAPGPQGQNPEGQNMEGQEDPQVAPNLSVQELKDQVYAFFTMRFFVQHLKTPSLLAKEQIIAIILGAIRSISSRVESFLIRNDFTWEHLHEIALDLDRFWIFHTMYTIFVWGVELSKFLFLNSFLTFMK